MHVSPFPPGIVTRGASVDDLDLVVALYRAAEAHDRGEADVTREDMEAAWAGPGFDLALDVLLVERDGRLVAAGEVPSWRAEAAVHPDARGQGIGTALLGWVESRALARAPDEGEVRVGQTIIDTHEIAADLFTRHGYSPRHTSWALRLPAGADIEARPLPDGVIIRPFDPLTEERAVYQVIEDAFNEWPTRQPSTFSEWRARATGRTDFDPSLLLVAVADGEVVGVSFGLPYPEEGWVEQLAVRADHRGRGLAKALLRATFEEFRRRGHPKVGLSTDSRTGALDLYLRVGMVVRSSYTHYSKVVREA